jgi:predicted ATP-binding protein involved in virulence
MILEQLHLTNFRCFQRQSVEFMPGFNLLVGVNGSGKTSLLNAVAEALAGFVNQFQSAHTLPLLADAAVPFRQVVRNGGVRFEPQFPVKVEAGGEIYGEAAIWTLHRDSTVAQVRVTGHPPESVWQRLHSGPVTAAEEAKRNQPLPLVLFFRAKRFWATATPDEVRAATLRVSRLDAYARWWDAAADEGALQTWVVGKSLERLQTASERGVPVERVDDDELAQVNAALREVIPGCEGLRYDLREKSIVLGWAGDRLMTFDMLSDGQRGLVAMVADIARRICVLNPQLGSAATRQTPGVVLIDELDAHLHPGWQRSVAGALRQAFPKLQFIAASHSPQVIGELKANEVILLRDGKVLGHPERALGLESGEVLEEIMGTGSRNAEVAERLRRIRHALEDERLEEAVSELQALESSVGEIPSVLQVRSELASLSWLREDGQP